MRHRPAPFTQKISKQQRIPRYKRSSSIVCATSLSLLHIYISANARVVGSWTNIYTPLCTSIAARRGAICRGEIYIFRRMESTSNIVIARGQVCGLLRSEKSRPVRWDVKKLNDFAPMRAANENPGDVNAQDCPGSNERPMNFT
jgi:hypothetical protein